VLEPPEPLTNADVSTANESNHEVRIFWALLASIVANAAAPALGYHPRGILLDGVGDQTVGSLLAVQLGCCEARATNNARRLTRYLGLHDWPLLVNLRMHGTFRQALADGLNTWMLEPVATRALIAPPWAMARVLAIRSEWNIVRCDLSLGSLRYIGRAAPRDCKFFGKGCSPEHPLGPCMVSAEGTCGIWYQNGAK
jgi:hypothetical protein